MVANRRRALLVLAAAWVAVAAGAANGQIKVGDEGHALDASQRVGSGGYNTPRPNLQLVNPNDIVYGNVTGGRGFRGNITGDPTQPFGGRSNLPSDRFARSANAVSAPGAPPLAPGVYAVPIYSSSPIGSPPTGFALNPYTGQYQSQGRVQPGLADIQYGVSPGTPILRPGADGDSQLILPANVNDGTGSGYQMTLTATPLLGIRPMTGLADEDRFLLSRSGGAGSLDQATLRKMRADMNQQDADDKSLNRQKPIDGKPLGAPMGADPADTSITPDPLSGPNPAFRKPPKYDPADHNPLLAELRKAEADRADKAAAAKAAAVPNKPAVPAPDASPSTQPASGGAPGNPPSIRSAPNAPIATGPDTLGYIAPIRVGALSETQKQEGMKMLLAGGEKMLAEGKYASAADRYEAASRFAPGDELIVVARAQALLGAGFFARADAGLRSAVAADPVVLNAQYDLRKSLGDARVGQLIEDLKRIALEDKSNAMPVTLLAYLAYNSGDEERAMALLAEARNRSANDPLVNAMRAHWAPKK